MQARCRAAEGSGSARKSPGTCGAGDSGSINFGVWRLKMGQVQIALARNPDDLRAVQRLRAERFRGPAGSSDMDRFDPHCLHVLARKGADGAPVAAARARLLCSPVEFRSCYTAQFYDLDVLAAAPTRALEIGRICVDRRHLHDPDALRALLAGITRIALDTRVGLLIGCASFAAARVEAHAPALAYLGAQHIGPAHLRPAQHGARETVALPRGPAPARGGGLRAMPELLRLYLGLGGWVSDHAVLDRDLDTLHVFTGVEIARIPPRRRRALQALAGA